MSPHQAGDPASTERADQVSANLASVRERIDAARRAAGRADAVELVVVTKTFPASDVDLLAGLGVADVGENRDQEARAKRADCGAQGQAMRWHMIGQLQRNKAASVARWADVVESVDRVALAESLARAAGREGRELDVLIQVDLDPQPRPDRGGVDPAEAEALADAVAALPGLALRGVMGVAPHPPALGGPRSAFARLRELSDRVARSHPGALVISAGMSDDLEEAVAEGATQVRIGGAVLGHRAGVQ